MASVSSLTPPAPFSSFARVLSVTPIRSKKSATDIRRDKERTEREALSLDRILAYKEI